MNWIKVTKTFADFAAAALTNDIEIYSLPSGALVHGVVTKHSASFTGGAIAAYTLSTGIVGNLTKYSSAFDVFQAPGDTVAQASNNFSLENWGSATSIRAAAIAVGANLDQAAAGTVEFYILLSQAKV